MIIILTDRPMLAGVRAADIGPEDRCPRDDWPVRSRWATWWP